MYVYTRESQREKYRERDIERERMIVDPLSFDSALYDNTERRNNTKIMDS